MTPESVGVNTNSIVLGKHSGKHAFVAKLKNLNIELEDKKVKEVFEKFKDLADQKKQIFDEDIQALVFEETISIPEYYKLQAFTVNIGTNITPSVSITLNNNGKLLTKNSIGDGSVDAAYNAIEKIIGFECELIDYKINAVSKGKDAQGEVVVVLTINKEQFRGHGLSTDVVKASIKAYLNAINKKIFKNEKK